MRIRSPLVVVAGITLVGGILRFSSLGLQSFWFDESITADLLQLSLGDMLSEIPDSESTPPVYYVCAWIWTKIFGSGDVAIRSLSALAGTLTIPVAYGAATRLVSQRAGFIAAAVCAVHPYLIWYSQEARAYAFLVLFTALALFCFADALRGGSGRSLALWALFSALALASHYFAAFVIAPQIVLLLVYARRRTTYLAIGGIALASLALLPLLLAQRSTGNADWISDEAVRDRIELVVEYFTTGRSGWVADWLVAVVLALSLAGAVLLVREWRKRGARRGEIAALTVGAAGLAIPAAIAVGGLDYFWHQNLIAAVVPLTVFVAAGLAEGRPQRLGLGAAAALVVLLAGVTVATNYSESSLHRDDFEDAADAVGPADGPRAVIVIPDWCGVTLERYMPELEEMPEEGVRVSEIAVVATTENHGCVRTGISADAPPPVAGFRRAGAERVQNLLVLRFRSERPRLAVPDRLDLLYQRAWPGDVFAEGTAPG
jgi:hypothetical protein